MTKNFNKEIEMFNCFKTLKLEENEDKSKKENFLETIQINNDFLLNCYSQEIDFRDILPNIQKASRGNFFYNKIVRRGFKHKSEFFKILFKAIKNANDEDKKKYISKSKRFNIFKLAEIELLKIKKNKIEKLFKEKKENMKLKKEKLNKYTELIKDQLSSSCAFNFDSPVKTPKILSPLNTLNLNNTNNSFNNNFNSKEKDQKILDLSLSNKDISTYYKSDIKFKTLTKNNSLSGLNSPRINKNKINYIYDKCTEEIENGNKVAKKVFKLNKNISKSIEKKFKNNKLMRGFQIIEDKGKKKDKYRQDIN